MRPRVAPIVTAALLAFAPPAQAIEPVESFTYLVTGNGFGFQVFDVNQNAIRQYLERPYRYLRANPSNPTGEGIVRRDLAFDTYFGVQAGAQSAWLSTRAPTDVGYLDQTNIIQSVTTVGAARATSYFFAPYGYEGNAMVMLLKVENTGGSALPVTAYSIHNFKLGSPGGNPDEPGAAGESVAFDAARASATETGPGGGVMVYAPIGGVDVSSCASDVYQRVAAGDALTMQASCSGEDRVNAFARDLGSIPAGETRWWGVAVLFDADGNASRARDAWAAFAADRGPEQVLTDALAEWEAWRTPALPGLSGEELRVWRQSEAVLRMGQILEPYSTSPRRKNHGMVLASLPPGGWHTGWVRDAMYAVVAFARTGHHAEAKKALNFFLDADAGLYKSYLGDVDYRISIVRYYGDGQEEGDYSGHPTPNVEIDGWGMFLWAARQYIDASGDTAWLDEPTQKGDTVYAAIKDGVAEALAAQLEDTGMAIADAGIWEVHWGNRQHWLYTTASTARGFCDMATIARRGGRDGDIERYRSLATEATDAIRTHFIDSNRVLAGSLEKLATGSNYRDGATVEAITWALLPANDPISLATMNEFSYLQTPAGGYKRLEGSNDQYDTDEWILIDLRASDAFRRQGNSDKADQLLGWVTAQATVNFDLLPELYNTRTSSGQIGAYSGSIPMVGYGAGAYQLTMLGRAGVYEHSDCGEQDLDDYPDAGPISGSDGGGGGGFDDEIGRTGVACACSGGGAPPAGEAVLFLGALALVLRRRSSPRKA